MKHIFLLILAANIFYANAQQIIHDKDAQVRKVEDFHSIDISNAIDLRISQGNENVVVSKRP